MNEISVLSIILILFLLSCDLANNNEEIEPWNPLGPPDLTDIKGDAGWSANGAQVIFYKPVEGFVPRDEEGTYLYDLSTGEEEQLSREFARDISTDGNFLLFDKYSAVYDGGDILITDVSSGDSLIFNAGLQSFKELSFSADGRSVTGIGKESGDSGPGVYRVNIETGQTERLYSEAFEPRDPELFDDKLLFTGSTLGQTDIFELNLSSGKLTNITNTPLDNENNPKWSADGSLRMFSRENAIIGKRANEDQEIILKTNSDSFGEGIHDFSMSADGSKIVFMNAVELQVQSFILDLRAGTTVPLSERNFY